MKPEFYDHTFRVRYAETDQMGVVHHAVYPVWFECGRTEFSHARKFPYKKIEDLGLAMALGEMNIRYRRPARYDQHVTVRTWVSRRKPRLIEFSYKVLDEEGQLLAEGNTVHIVVDMETFKPAKLTDEILHYFQVWKVEE